jgi:methyl-accepting chemotaxis protein
MNWFRNLKIGKKLYLLLFISLAGMVGMGAFNLNRMQKVFDSANYCADNSLPSIITLNKCIAASNALTGHTYQHILNTDASKMAEINTGITTAREDFAKATKEYETLVADDKDKQLLAGDRAAMADVAEARNKVFALSRENKNVEADDLFMKEVVPRTEKLEQALNAHMKYNVELSANGTKNALKANHDAKIASYTIILLVGVAVALLAFGVSQAITRPIGTCVDVADRLAEGDLTVAITVNSKDETGMLLSSMKNMTERLRDLMTKLSELSSGIASASNELHSTAEQIATGAEEIAAQTNTVATASEEMSATSTDIARNCTMAAEASRHTGASATEGSNVVNQTITGMNTIADRVKETSKTVSALGARSEQIGQIVGTIEDIADQTNLLALNAAIEAARAGEQGRGFAVVADEVRALAERTTKATREIGEMIKAIQNETKAAVRAMEEGVIEVEKGAESSQRSGQALEEILCRVNEVTTQINQIATAAEEQTATTSEVTTNIQQVTEIVQQSARGAEETASAASQLANQAQQLQGLVRRFRV